MKWQIYQATFPVDFMNLYTSPPVFQNDIVFCMRIVGPYTINCWHITANTITVEQAKCSQMSLAWRGFFLSQSNAIIEAMVQTNILKTMILWSAMFCVAPVFCSMFIWEFAQQEILKFNTKETTEIRPFLLANPKGCHQNRVVPSPLEIGCLSILKRPHTAFWNATHRCQDYCMKVCWTVSFNIYCESLHKQCAIN